MLTDTQRRHLCDLMFEAFLEVRRLGWNGRAEQAADLADAFHNLPQGLWWDNFNLFVFRDSYLLHYERKYGWNERIRSYVTAVDAIIGMAESERGSDTCR
jgi:hypothetical protein